VILQLLKVTGRSLTPEYQDGDFVLTSRIPLLLGRLRGGDVVVFQHALYGTLIKRVDHIQPEHDEIYVRGLLEDSVDSRRFGPINRRSITGKVVWHIRRPHD